MPWIQNFDSLARTPARRDALLIVDAGLDAVDTRRVIERAVTLQGTVLRIRDKSWDISGFKSLQVIGFGKTACAAAKALEMVLDRHISGGIIIGPRPGTCNYVSTCEASHPLPSMQNVESSRRIVALCGELTAEDLVIVIVSGGGSAMLCWPSQECEQGQRLYGEALRSGMTIGELNTIRKHISLLKGGGLAKELHPATVIGLIFSDVPGVHPEQVASGPTYYDPTTIADAQKILDRYKLGSYTLGETPKERDLFKDVTNIVLVSNVQALDAMSVRARELGYEAKIAGVDLYQPPREAVQMLQAASAPHTAVLGGGEFRLRIPKTTGRGGRNQSAALEALTSLASDQVFIALASDGQDNCDAAGAIVDAGTLTAIRAHKIDLEKHIRSFDEYPVLEKTGDLIFTGLTQANVSDLMVLLTR